MNCANHPDLPVSAYCQNCGKPLCTQCVRSVAGVVYCEPCLAARLSPGSTYAGGASASASGAASRPGASASSSSASPGSAAWGQVPVAANPRFGGGPSPVLAGFLGFIPGVGAMYNGQFVKAFAHVIIFVIAISIAQHFDAAGILVAAWVFYQVFDAVQTAIARRDGTLLPDPFGLNDLGQRLGVPAAGGYAVPPTQPVPSPGASSYTDVPPPAAQAPYVAPPMPDPSHPDFQGWTERTAAERAFHDQGIPTAPGASPQAGYQPIAPLPPVAYVGRSEPIGAIVLIGVGILFLLSTLGVFQWEWFGRGWPVLIILIGAGLLFSRVRATRRAGGAL